MSTRTRVLLCLLAWALSISVISYATGIDVHEAEYCAVYPTCQARLTSVHGL